MIQTKLSEAPNVHETSVIYVAVEVIIGSLVYCNNWKPDSVCKLDRLASIYCFIIICLFWFENKICHWIDLPILLHYHKSLSKQDKISPNCVHFIVWCSISQRRSHIFVSCFCNKWQWDHFWRAEDHKARSNLAQWKQYSHCKCNIIIFFPSYFGISAIRFSKCRTYAAFKWFHHLITSVTRVIFTLFNSEATSSKKKQVHYAESKKNSSLISVCIVCTNNAPPLYWY